MYVYLCVQGIHVTSSDHCLVRPHHECAYLHAFLQCSPQHIIRSFAKLKKVPELVQYLHQVTI